jgi:plastocyanin
MKRVLWVGLVLLACGVVAPGCGSSPTTPSSDQTITITANGFTPSEVRVPLLGRVTFVNNDVRAHAINSDPVQLHTDCLPINDVGFLNPGESRPTGQLNVTRTCGYHDHLNEFDPTWKGRIIVQ